MHPSQHKEYQIVFQPGNRSVFALVGTTVFEAAIRAGLSIKNPCGGNGTCGKCRVRIIGGECPPSLAGQKHFSATEIKHGLRLACQAKIQANCIIEVPDESLFESSAQILIAAETHDLTISPCLSKHYIEMDEPKEHDGCADTSRLEKALERSLKIPLALLRGLPERLREQQFKGTVVLYGNRMLAFELGDTTATAYGIAFDLGTTTVVGSLMNLIDGREVAVAAAMNPQIETGDDVISRIHKVRENKKNLTRMQSEITGVLNQIITELTTQAEIEREEIYEVAVAGNTAMQHIFCGISPEALGEIPFSAACQKGILCLASECNLTLHPQAPLYVFPHIGGFVGGDTVAGIMAALLHTGEKNRILVDIGTNGEIVTAVNGQLLAASTAAGPAFEGARIVNGMRATKGAIEKIIAVDGDIDYNVIGNCPPLGLCGTALIDLVAELLRHQIIDSTGRILPPEQIDESISPGLRERLMTDEKGHVDFLIVKAEESGNGQNIILYQRDVRELQLATGAIRAGLNILLKKAGIEVDQIESIMLAGAFGNFIRRSNARRIGLLPQVPTQKINFIGNAASMGAKLVLLSKEIRGLAEKMAARCEHLELSADPEFQMEFATAMIFPEHEPFN